MNKYLKLTILALIVFAFIYGLAVGHFRIFPFHQIINLKNKVSSIADFGKKNDVSTDLLKEDVEVIETSLHRLLLKKIHLQYGMDIGRGGTMTSLGYRVYMNVNSNNENRDLIQIYNLENRFQYMSETLRAPMNYKELLSSPLVEIEGFDLFRYRISGLYAEKNIDGSHTLYASHNFYEKDQNCISFKISKLTISFQENSLLQETEWKTIFTADPCIFPEKNTEYSNPFPGHMAGGKMAEYDENTLLVSVGSFSTDPELYYSLPMDPSSSFGKILLIDKETGSSKIYAKGLRNSQGLLIDNKGTIWATDHGPRGGDELNIIVEGANYGWPIETYGTNYGSMEWPFATNQGRHENYDKPKYVWMPAIAPTNILQIQGNKFSLWNGDLIIGSLTGRSLHRLRIEGGQIIYNEVIHLGYRVRDLTILPDEKLLLLTDEGSLFIIDDGGPVYDEIEAEIQVRIAGLELYDELLGDVAAVNLRLEALNAEAIFSRHCSACHFLNEINDVGPHLNNLFNRQVGSLEYFNYSYDLNENEEFWSPELLRSFLIEPKEKFPNTTMPKMPITSAEADSIISVFNRQNR